MDDKKPAQNDRSADYNTSDRLSSLLCSVIRCANLGIRRNEFLNEVSHYIIDYLNCDSVILSLFDYEKTFSFEIVRKKRSPKEMVTDYNIMGRPFNIDLETVDIIEQDDLNYLLTTSEYKLEGPNLSDKGSFFTRGRKGLYDINIKHNQKTFNSQYRIERGYQSIASIPLSVKNDTVGLLILKSQTSDFFIETNITLCETIAETVASAAQDRNRQLALRERVKELGCLYSISKIIELPDLSLDEILKKVVEIIPPAWLYPDITAARIVFDKTSFTSEGFINTSQKLTSRIIIEGVDRGVIEVVYMEDMPEIYEGPFLLEERNLLDAVAQQLSQIIKRNLDEDEKKKLQVQIQHADRLATVGQLAAGVAHELNEPLGNILGFAQIILDEVTLEEQLEKDLKKIEESSLYAREIVKKLLLFARQMPQKRSYVDINQVIENTIFFFESRCQKEGIEVIKDFDKNIPEIHADPAQIQQIVTNLVVNAVQAMSYGDTLNLSTALSGDNISIVVQDNGAGMDDEVKKNLFIPFYTTKDINEGTGLGLSVVHGIVQSHDGSIDVESTVGESTRFEILLPVKHKNKTES